MQESRWAPIVYSRSRDVDFRFMALPEDGPSIGMSALIVERIRPMLASVAALRGSPSWTVFTTGTHCIFGAAAYVSDIVAEPSEPDITIVGTRLNYTFTGYAARLAAPVMLPRSEQLELALLRSLLEFVRKHWEEREHSRTIDWTPYSALLPVVAGGSSGGGGWTVQSQATVFSPVERSAELWNDAAAALALPAPPPIALCTNLPHRHSARGSSYLHITARDVHEIIIEQREEPEPEREPLPRPREERQRNIPISPRARSRAGGPHAPAYRAATKGFTALIAGCLAWKNHWLLTGLALIGGGLVLLTSRSARRQQRTPAAGPAGFGPAAARPRNAREESPWD